MNRPSILSAAKKAGVKYYFIEDESPSSVQQVPQRLKFMEQVKFWGSPRRISPALLSLREARCVPVGTPRLSRSPPGE